MTDEKLIAELLRLSLSAPLNDTLVIDQVVAALTSKGEEIIESTREIHALRADFDDAVEHLANWRSEALKARFLLALMAETFEGPHGWFETRRLWHSAMQDDYENAYVQQTVADEWRKVAQSSEALTARMRGALEEAEEVFALVEHPRLEDRDYGAEVRALGERIGYGALMSSASASWRIHGRAGAGCEFVAGPCQVTVTKTLALIRAALTPSPTDDVGDHK